jgi:uncharacterized protein (TIGR01777 family)
MRIAISGSSGLIGGALAKALAARGDEVVRLVREGGGTVSRVLWNPTSGLPDPSPLEAIDAVVHLAGAGIADKRWSESRKELLYSSRVVGTRSLVGSLGELARPPRRFLCGSAVGYYGDRGDEVLTEKSGDGSGFLAGLCVAWEKEAQAARAWAERVYSLRTGVVLSTAGGALPRMLPPFRLGVGGVLGSGEQYMSWISIADEVGAILHLLESEMSSGAVNLTAPAPSTNRFFTTALGRALKRPTIFPVPAFVIRTLFGQMGDEALLGSQRVMPERLQRHGYRFAHPDLDGALEAVLAGRA